MGETEGRKKITFYFSHNLSLCYDSPIRTAYLMASHPKPSLPSSQSVDSIGLPNLQNLLRKPTKGPDVLMGISPKHLG